MGMLGPAVLGMCPPPPPGQETATPQGRRPSLPRAGERHPLGQETAFPPHSQPEALRKWYLEQESSLPEGLVLAKLGKALG